MPITRRDPIPNIPDMMYLARPSAMYFPMYGWESKERMPRPHDPSRLCPSFSFINDFFAKRKEEKLHHAIDIFAPEGTPVISPVSGYMWPNVKFGDSYTGYKFFERGGYHFYIFGDDGIIYYGAHLLGEPFKNPGQRVEAGEIIGFVGRSGVVSGCPHLHFAMYQITSEGRKGKVINPYSYLVNAFEETFGMSVSREKYKENKPEDYHEESEGAELPYRSRSPYVAVGFVGLGLSITSLVIGVLSSRKKRRR